MPSSAFGPLELLVIQPTPFCNIDCSYCYLPDRQKTNRMALPTLDQTFEWVFSSGLIRDPFTLLWHAGEPLVMPIAFYRDAIRLLELHNERKVEVRHSFQTNATLIDAAWCHFIREHSLYMGVSVDGPGFLHDRHRRTRQGEGTLDRVLRGVRLLVEADIPFYVISVLTAESLDYPDELFDFYRDHGITSVAFNVEEIEGPNTTSSLSGAGMAARFRRFLTRFVELAMGADPPLPVREFSNSVGAVLGDRFGPGARTQENRPWGIVNVDWEGNFSTYSPELLGLPSPRHGGFALGHVARDSLASVVATERFARIEEEIARGVEMCRASCDYFAFCGGGAPANKHFENGTFASTETLFCRLHKQVCLDVAVGWLEQNAVPGRAPA
ncbi:MAG: cyclophane-forming radical SAM/SPASM peptide maturase GrrM/OscB [Gemmataceae bacterium]